MPTMEKRQRGRPRAFNGPPEAASVQSLDRALRILAIVAEGKPAEIITEELVEDVFGLPSIIIPDPVAGTPMIVPKQKKVPATGEVACQAQPSRASRPDLTAASRLNGLSSSRIPRKPHQG